jgi:hypothetical protein
MIHAIHLLSGKHSKQLSVKESFVIFIVINIFLFCSAYDHIVLVQYLEVAEVCEYYLLEQNFICMIYIPLNISGVILAKSSVW